MEEISEALEKEQLSVLIVTFSYTTSQAGSISIKCI